MAIKMEQGTPDEIALAFLPLKEVGEQIAEEMRAAGTDKHCSICCKPFNAARKQRGVARVTHMGESGLLCSTWMLCGKCIHDAKRNGWLFPIKLKQEARQSYEALRLMQARPEGTA